MWTVGEITCEGEVRKGEAVVKGQTEVGSEREKGKQWKDACCIKSVYEGQDAW